MRLPLFVLKWFLEAVILLGYAYLMPRPTKLSIHTRNSILNALRLGSTRAHAAAYAGISERALYTWLKRGAEEKRGLYVQFVQDVKKAEGQCTHSMLTVIQKAAESDWKAAAWCLERCRGYTRTNALRLSVDESEQDDAKSGQSARDRLLAKLELMAGGH